MEKQDFSMQDDAEMRFGFWASQFSETRTNKQLFFDVLFGIVFPIVCLIFDPGVFRSAFGSSFLMLNLTGIKLLAYEFCSLSMIVLVVWLVFQRRLGKYGKLLSGILWAASGGAFLIGVIIFPLTLIGLIIVIGILGLIPFFTTFVFLRNGIRAFKSSSKTLSYSRSVLAPILGAGLIIGIPTGLHLTVNSIMNQSLNNILNGQSTLSAINRLKSISWLINLDDIVRAYQKENDPIRRANLANAYFSLTNNDISRMIERLDD